MSWLDTVILIIALVFGLAGLWKGIFGTAFGIAGVVGGIYLAGHYYQQLGGVLSSSEAVWARVVAYAIILIATMLLAGAIGWFIARLIHLTALGWVDRLIGFVLGAATGCLLCAAVLAIANKLMPGAETFIAASPVAEFLLDKFTLLLPLLPGEFDFAREFFT